MVAVSVVANPFFRIIIKKNGYGGTADYDNSEMPKITVLVLANNNAKALDNHLPIILTQDYKPGYEVVVVGEVGDIETETVIKQYAQNSNLYATYIPHRSLFMSKAKLAVALGVKAAHNEWIVLVNSDCRPQSDQWLSTLASHMDKDANLVVGYSNYCLDTSSRRRFMRLRDTVYLLRKAARGTAYRANGTNIAFRRAEFIANDGYRGNLQFVHGEYDFIINKYARPYSTRVATEESSWIREDEPSNKKWHDRNIAYAHIRQFLQRSSAMRCLFNADMIMMYLNYVLLLVSIVSAVLVSNWTILTVAIVGFVTTVALRSVMAKKVADIFGEDISALKTIFYELAIVWTNMFTQIRYSRADKYDFTTHKL